MWSVKATYGHACRGIVVGFGPWKRPISGGLCHHVGMIFLDDSYGKWFATTTRREMVDALLEHLDDEPSDWQLMKLGAACLGYREDLTIMVTED